MAGRGATVRNVVILVIVALAVWRLPGGALGERAVSNFIALVFWTALAFFVYKLYMERRTTLLGWDERLRMRLYGAAGLLMITIVATSRMFSQGGFGGLAWFVLIGVAVMGIFTAVRASRAY